MDHIKCAAFELPFTGDGGLRPTRRAGNPRRALPEQGLVHQRRFAATAGVDGTVDATSRTPADAVSLRSVSSDNFVVVDTHDESARHRRDRLHERTGDAASRRPSTSSRASSIRWSGSISRAARRSCARSTATTTPTRSRYTRVTRASSTFASDSRRALSARRGPRRVARRRLQEDQVLHERERRLGRARSARAADAHDVLLADDSGER